MDARNFGCDVSVRTYSDKSVQTLGKGEGSGGSGPKTDRWGGGGGGAENVIYSCI